MSEAASARTQVKRHADRAAYDRPTIDAILDEALFCHVAWPAPEGVRIIPTIHARVGDLLYLHGSAASRTMKGLKEGLEVSIAVTLLDGLVLARSAFHHSMNYRSAVLYGTATEVTDRTEQTRTAQALTEKMVVGRSEQARMPTDDELRQTTMLSMPIAEASAKIRTGPPVDDAADLDLDVWAGIVPISLTRGTPVPSPDLGSHALPPPT